VPTEWIVLVWSIKHVATITKEFCIANQINNQTLFSKGALQSCVKMFVSEK